MRLLARRANHKPSRPTARGNDTLSNLIQAVRLSAAAVEAAQVPHGKGIFGAVERILTIVQEMRDDYGGCFELAKISAELAMNIEATGKIDMDDEWISNLENLKGTLDDIVKKMTAIIELGWFKRLIHQKSIKDGLAESRRLINHYVQAFGVVSHIGIKKHLVSQDKTLAKISQKVSPDMDEGFYIFPLADIRLRKEIVVPEDTSESPRSRGVARYTASVPSSGELLVAKAYVREHDEHFQEDLAMLKSLRHPNLTQLIGYSQQQVSTTSPRFLVLRGGVQSCKIVQKCLEGVERYTFAVQTASAFISAQSFLKSRSLNWSGGYQNLFVDDEKRLSLEIGFDQVRPFQDASFQEDIFTIINEVTYMAVSPKSSGRQDSNGSAPQLLKVAYADLEETFSKAKMSTLDLRTLWVKLVLPGFLYESGANVTDWYKQSAKRRKREALLPSE